MVALERRGLEEEPCTSSSSEDESISSSSSSSSASPSTTVAATARGRRRRRGGTTTTMAPAAAASVSFGQIEVWCFPPIIGDNPSVSSGVPIALGSRPLQQCSTVEQLELYELRRPPRRSTRDLKINSKDREEMLLCVGYGLEEINAATKKPERRRTRAHKLLHPSSTQSLHAALRGMVLPHFSSASSSRRNGGGTATPRRGSLAKSRVDELEDEGGRHQHRPPYSDAPPKPGRRRGSLTLSSSSSPSSDANSSSSPSARLRSMRRWSSDQNLSPPNRQHPLRSDPPRRPAHRRESFSSSSSSSHHQRDGGGSSSDEVRPPPAKNSQSEGGGGDNFWSRLKDSSPASPQPAQRRGSVQDLAGICPRQLEGDGESDPPSEGSATSEPDDDMLHHFYQYGDAAPAVRAEKSPLGTTTRRSRRRSSSAAEPASAAATVASAPPSKATTRRWSLHGGHKGLDASPRPGFRRSSIAQDGPEGGKTVAAAAAVAAAAEEALEGSSRPRRRSSFFGVGGGGLRDTHLPPTERRSSLGSALPAHAVSAPSSSTASVATLPRGGPLPTRRRSFLGALSDLPQWSPAKSDRDETESSTAVSVASSGLHELRRQMEPSSLLGPLPDLDLNWDHPPPPRRQPPQHLQPQLQKQQPQRRRSFLGGFREGAANAPSETSTVPAVDHAPAPQRRRSSFLGSFREPPSAASAPVSGAAPSAIAADDSVHSHSSSSGRGGGGGSSSSGEGLPPRRRASLLGGILAPRDGTKSIAAV